LAKQATREAYGKALVALGAENSDRRFRCGLVKVYEDCGLC